MATYAAENLDGGLIAKELTAIMGFQVGLSKDLHGLDLGKAVGSVGDLYFDKTKLRLHLKNVGRVGKGAKKMDRYRTKLFLMLLVSV